MAKDDGNGIFGEQDSRVGPSDHGKGEAHPKLTNETVFGEDDSRVEPECPQPSAPKGEQASNYR